ncbi:MAG: RNA polymerase sigma factor [Ktedonobacteraceae bacterium]
MHHLNEDEVQDDKKSALYDRFAAIILAYLCQMVSNRQDAEDLLLEVFMAAFNNEMLSGLPARRQLAWLRHVARNKTVDRYRHAARLTMLPLDQAGEAEDEGLTPQQHAERQQSYECLSQAFEQLSPIQQELIWLRYGRDLRLTQIAEMFEKPAGTVRKLLSRTLHQLRHLYEQSERGD